MRLRLLFEMPRGGLRSSAWDHADEIIKLYKSGQHTYDLASMFGVSANTILSILKSNNISMRRKSSVWDHAKEIIRLYNSGLSTTDVGSRFNTSFMTVKRILDSAGVELRSPGRSYSPLRDRADELADKFRSGLTFREIALEFGVGATLIQKIIRSVIPADEIKDIAHVRRVKTLTGKPQRKHLDIWKHSGRVRNLYASGKSISAIASIFGVSSDSVLRVLNSLGVELRDIRNQYTVWGDVLKAIKTLGIESGAEYKARYKEDPRLPFDPWSMFGVTKNEVFGTKTKGEREFPAYNEAKMIFNVNSIRQYRQIAKDLGLPSNPQYTYGARFEWVDWDDFLGDSQTVSHQSGQFRLNGDVYHRWVQMHFGHDADHDIVNEYFRKYSFVFGWHQDDDILELTPSDIENEFEKFKSKKNTYRQKLGRERRDFGGDKALYSTDAKEKSRASIADFIAPSSGTYLMLPGYRWNFEQDLPESAFVVGLENDGQKWRKFVRNMPGEDKTEEEINGVKVVKSNRALAVPLSFEEYAKISDLEFDGGWLDFTGFITREMLDGMRLINAGGKFVVTVLAARESLDSKMRILELSGEKRLNNKARALAVANALGGELVGYNIYYNRHPGKKKAVPMLNVFVGS